MTLDMLKLNEEGLIKKVSGLELLKRRLLDLGFIPGEITKCVLISPFREPKAYLINNNVIALRSKDAKNVEVELCIE